MRRQIDMDVRVFPLGQGNNNSMTREQVSAFVRENYFDKGTATEHWEIVSVLNNQVAAGVAFTQVNLVKWKEEAVE